MLKPGRQRMLFDLPRLGVSMAPSHEVTNMLGCFNLVQTTTDLAAQSDGLWHAA